MTTDVHGCLGGRISRYIIDYYHEEVDGSSSDANAMKNIHIDVRPSFDNFFGLYTRVFLMPFKRVFGMSDFQPLPFFPPKKLTLSEHKHKEKIQKQWEEIRSRCANFKEQLKTCSTEEQCGAAAIALQRCTASVVCPEVVETFDACIAKQRGEEAVDADLEKAFTNMSKCLELFEIDTKEAMK